ncbi:MAG: MotA/TolQ/ExbB proton channel family protein [Halofilum sp. (in: g-proteobacteria)]
MFELVKAGGWLMAPIIACSVVALAIIVERAWSLREKQVVPDYLVAEVWRQAREGKVTEEQVRSLREHSPLGRILAVGLLNRQRERAVIKEAIEENGRAVAHELDRFLTALGTIAAITPLLGLLGTVIGMISVFTTITQLGVGNPGELAGGISQALITTAAGLSVAIPSLIFHRHFRGKVEYLTVQMEQEAVKLVEILAGERAQSAGSRAA